MLEGLDTPTEISPERLTLAVPDGALDTLSVTERRLGLRLLTWNTVVDSDYGPLLFEPGAFVSPAADGSLGPVDPRTVRLRMDHDDPPTGIGLSYQDRGDAPVMDFRVARTPRGDEQLTLAREGISRGASVGYGEVPTRIRTETRDGRRVRIYGPGSAVLSEVSTTWRPTFPGDAVTHVLKKEAGPMAETTQDVPVAGTVDTAPIASAIRDGYDQLVAALATARNDETMEKILSRMEQMSEQMRLSAASVPPVTDTRRPKLHHWVEATLKRMAGQPLRPEHLRELALDDVVTTEQPGLVPTQFTPDYDDLISATRPFLNSTRRIEAPATGNSMVLPIITTRAVAGTQAGGAEKGALTTTATKVGTGTFAYQPVFGGADISMQMILRSERSFFDLLTGDMAEAYALDCEAKAVAALLAGYTDSAGSAHAPASGGVLDPEDPAFGTAWKTSIVASKRAPDHIWMSADAVAAFIDAKAPLTNAPLYSQLAAAFTAGGGTGGVLSGLIPVYVPALDDESVDVIIGPARGFVWAEDAARRLEADRPDVAGRDIAIVGGIFPAPRFAHAFTTYTIAGS